MVPPKPKEDSPESKLHKKKRKPLAARANQWMAPIALIVSITVGGFQVYDNTVLREQEKIEKDRSTFSDYVRKITELNSRLVSFQYSTSRDDVSNSSVQSSASTAMAVKNLMQIINIEKMSILELANDLITRNPAASNYAGLIVLSLESMNSGNVERAKMYAKTASDRAKTTIEKSEALRIQALTWFTAGRPEDILKARDMFSEAIQILTETGFMKAGLIANVYRDWISVEAVFGDCAEGRRLLEDFGVAIKKENNGFMAWDIAQEEIFRNTLNSDCNLYSNP